MRKNFTLFTLFLLGSLALNAQNEPIITGHESFETWNAASIGELPEYFDGTNIVVIAGFVEVETVTKGTAAPQEGSSYVVMEGKDLQGNTIPGIVTYGTIDYNNMTITGGLPYTTRSAQLKGYYKYTPAAGDSAIAIAYLTKNSTDTIAIGAIKFDATVTVWTEFTADLVYLSNLDPDTLNIILSSSADVNTAQVGSKFEVDNIWLEGVVTSIENVNNNFDFSVNPNPANDIINIKMGNTKNVTVNIHNAIGKIVLTKTFNNISSLDKDINLSELNSGIYFIEVINNGKSQTKKLVIN